MKYKYCGIIINTNIRFPFFWASNEEPMVEIIKTDKYICYNQKPFVFNDGVYYIVNFEDKGFYKITKTKVLCCFSDEKFLKATICNIPMAIIAILNGLIPFHSSSIMTQNLENVFLFAGDKGKGKTTFALYFNSYLKYDVFGDDVVTLFSENDIIFANKGTSMLKICDDAIDIENNKCIEVYPAWGKYYYTPKQYTKISDSVKVKSIFLIDRGKEFSLHKTQFFMKKIYLVRNIVGISYIGDILSQEIYNLIQNFNIPDMYTLVLPEGKKILEHTIDDIRLLIESI